MARSAEVGQGGAAAARCLDCRARVRRHSLVHDATCPVGLGAEAIKANDASWFETHPWAPFRRRRVTWAEHADAKAVGIELPSHVRVVQLVPGVRVRCVGGDQW